MEKMTKEKLKKAAKNVMIDMSEEEYDKFLNNFDNYAKNLAILEQLEVPENTEPMVFPYEVETTLRDDAQDEVIEADEAFKNSSCYKDGKIVIGKVVK